MQTAAHYAPKAKSIYPSASPETKGVLESIFGAKFFQPIMDRVKTLEDACEITGENPKDDKFHKGDPQIAAFHRLKTKIKALSSEQEKRTYKDPNQPKWFPVFRWDGSGFRFNDSDYAGTGAFAGAGSGLCLPNEEISNYVGRQFIEDWNIWLDEQ